MNKNKPVVYKLTDANRCTRDMTKWVHGKWLLPGIPGGLVNLCTATCLHAFTNPWYAVLLQPKYCYDFEPARLFVAETKGMVLSDDGVKVGSQSMRVVKELVFTRPSLTKIQKLYYRLAMVDIIGGPCMTKEISNCLSPMAIGRYKALYRAYRAPATYRFTSSDNKVLDYADTCMQRMYATDTSHIAMRLKPLMVSSNPKTEALILKLTNKILGEYPIKEAG